MILGSISSILTASLLALAGVPLLEAEFKSIHKKYDLKIFSKYSLIYIKHMAVMWTLHGVLTLIAVFVLNIVI